MIDLSALDGVVVPLATPLTAEEKVDTVSLRKLIDHLLAGVTPDGENFPVQGIFVNSTTGETHALTHAEQERALQIVVEHVAGRCLVLAGVSDVGTQRALEKLRRAEEAGVDVAIAHPPYFYLCNAPAETFAYFKKLAEHARIPLMLYNNPPLTKSSIDMQTVRELMQFENIIGIKESSADYLYLTQMIQLKKELRPEFRIFIGKAFLWTAGITAGADGMLDTICNLIPGLAGKLYRLLKSGNLPEALPVQEKINSIWSILRASSYLSALKTALHLMGLGDARVTHPIMRISDDEVKWIREIMSEHGIL